eukprot:jgi/Ulvmu1/6577/UM003_0214.1
MKALILVGGYGTRLRPLTLTVPKPLVEFANKPMIIHQIEALKRAGCTEVILAISYRAEVMRAFCDQWEKQLGVKITLSHEDEPLGTAGPLALAREILDDGSGEPFFVLNSDVICAYPLSEMMAFHKQKGAEATILVTKVEDPSKYGVIIHNTDGLVQRFVEKPKEFVGDKINAGIYVCSPEILRRIPATPTSIEKEVFPHIAQENKLYTLVLGGYWMDVGQPKDFLTGQALHLSSLAQREPASLASGDHIRGAVVIDPSAVVGKDCIIGPDVSIGPNAVIGDGVRLRDCVIMQGCTIKSHSYVCSSIVGWYSKVGRWARVENTSILGEDVSTKDELLLNGAIVLPHKELKASVVEPKIIM